MSQRIQEQRIPGIEINQKKDRANNKRTLTLMDQSMLR
jgi:hypothetical protein